jgi:hypothetical protein
MDILAIASTIFQPFDGAGLPPPLPRTKQIRQAVYSRLMSIPAITDLVGSRIYFGALPQSLSLFDGPAITYFIVTRPYGMVLGGSDGGSSARVQINAHGINQQTSSAIAQAIRDSWDGFKGIVNEVDIMASILQGQIDLPSPPMAGSDQWLYQVSTDYLMLHRVAFRAGV